MLENINKLDESMTEQQIEQVIEKDLNISMLDIKENFKKYILNNSEKLVSNAHNIIPFGDYGNIIEDKNEMQNFLKEDASKAENWQLFSISEQDNLLQLTFNNSSVDEGDNLKGHVFISGTGKIRHLFVQLN